MSEAEVELIAMKTVNAYDEKIGAPRHVENRKDIKTLTRICYVGIGIILTLQAALSMGLIPVHVAAK